MKHNNNNILQEKLQTHKMPIDDSFWKEIQARLKKEKYRKIVAFIRTKCLWERQREC